MPSVSGPIGYTNSALDLLAGLPLQGLLFALQDTEMKKISRYVSVAGPAIGLVLVAIGRTSKQADLIVTGVVVIGCIWIAYIILLKPKLHDMAHSKQVEKTE